MMPETIPDRRLRRFAMEMTAQSLAAELGGVVDGDGSVVVTGVAGLRDALPGDASFLGHPKYQSLFQSTRATTVLVTAEQERGDYPGALIRIDDPGRAFQELVMKFARPMVSPRAGIHPSAIIAEGVTVGDDVGIGAHAVVEAGAVIGRGTRIGAGCVVGHEVVLGEECLLHPLVSIREHCEIGDRVILHNGTVIGSDGFGYDVQPDGSRIKVDQVGAVRIGNDVEIGANCTVDRARFGMTRIGDRVKIDNLVMIAHNVVVEDDVVIVAQVGISGSSIIRRKAILGGQTGVVGHVVVGEEVIVGGKSMVTKDVAPKTYFLGNPAMPYRKTALIRAHLNRLPQLKERIAQLEKRIAELEKNRGG